jgi:hypothetical protein
MGNLNDSLKNPTEEREWKAFRERFEEGQLVEGIVVRHEPYGMFVDLGHPRFLALVHLSSMEPLPASPGFIRPAVGSRIRAVYLGIYHQEPQLRSRATALRAVESLQHVADLPTEQRQATLFHALSSQEPDVPSAAVWAVRYLPMNERRTFLQKALVDHDGRVAGLAIRQVAHLPEEELAAFLRQAVQQQEKSLAERAVWIAPHLPLQERRLFLEECDQHPSSLVRVQARAELERLLAEHQSEG